VLVGELWELARWCGARLHVLTGPSTVAGPTGPVLGPAHLAMLVPDARRRDVYVCGPPGMTEAVLRTLTQLRVPAEQVHTERFAFAA
jgi:ferredoxin-NADP reductase